MELNLKPNIREDYTMNINQIAAEWDLLLGEIKNKGYVAYSFNLSFTRQEKKPLCLSGYFRTEEQAFNQRVQLTGANSITDSLYFETVEEVFAFVREELAKIPSEEERRKRALLKTLSDAKVEAADLGLDLDLAPAVAALSSNLLEYHGG